MKGLVPSGKSRAMAALVAAYAIALQAVFTVLAPMQVQADGTIAVYCSGSGNAVVPDTDDPATPAPAPGKMQCVFCGACSAGSVILPGAASPAYQRAEGAASPVLAACCDRPVAIHARDGPARAPPLSV